MVNLAMLKSLILYTLLCFFGSIQAQSQQSTDSMLVYSTLRAQIKHVRYPAIAKEVGLHGTVEIRFDVEESCSFVNRRITRGIGGGCEEEVMRILSLAEQDLRKKLNGHCRSMKNLLFELKFKL